MMKFSLTNRLYTGFSVAIVLVLLIGILSYRTFQRITEAGILIKHTYQVLNNAEKIEKLMVDMETGHLSYRSTGVRLFFKPYTDALQNIRPVINDLSTLIADNPVQVARVDRIVANVETLLVFWNQQVNDNFGQYRQKDFIDIITREKVFTDRIRDELDQVIRTERQLLAKREQENKASIEQRTYELILGTVLTLMIVLTLIYFTIKEFNSHRQAEIILQDNYKELEHLNQISTEKNWLLTGMSIINDNLQDINDITSLTQSILKTMTAYLSFPASAFYCYSERDQELQLNASVALSGHLQTTYKLGEGLVGQAATEKSITILDDVPPSFWTIKAGSGQGRPGQVVYLPLWYNKKLKGIMEFASFRPVSDQALLMLRSVANNIAVAINAADYYEKAMNLLQQVREQKKELEKQREELQKSNDELVRQAKVLQMSEQELKIQEEELRQINTELLDRNTAVESARTELSVKAKELEINSKYKSEFLANMSHELRTPLNSVLILAQLLVENKQQNLTSKQVEYANIIHKSGSDLLELINDILDLSKIEAGKIDLLFELASTSEIIQDMNQLFTVVADQKGVKLVTQIDDRVPATILTDKLRLEQIIKNLLSNAFKFTPKGGSVTLALSLDDRPANSSPGLSAIAKPILSISVTDTGIGISPEKQQIIFEAFQQADGAINRKFGGTGLGLSICKELIRRLGGELGLKSDLGSGSTFTAYLPVEAVQEVKSVTPVIATQPSPVIHSISAVKLPVPPDDRHDLAPGDKVILIIEDDPAFASIIQDFARLKSFKTIIALRGDEGLQYARQYVPSAIIMDLGLPVISGWDILKLVKNDEALKHIPVHVISVFDEPSTVNKDIQAYTTKPVEKKDLDNVLAIINNHLGYDGKKTLVITGKCLKETSLKPLIAERHIKIECDYVNTWDEARKKVEKQSYECVIADLGQQTEQGIVELYALKKAASLIDSLFIIYLDNDNSVNVQQLTQIPNVIIWDASQSKDQLMDELALFINKVRQSNFAFQSKLPEMTAVQSSEGMRGKKVLLVDDDMRNVFALSTLLEENELIVVTAGDGHDALDQLSQHPDTHIVLMDIMMPEMDGYEATRRIRADKRFMNLPVIALTARAMNGDRDKCLEAGASDYVTKPIDSSLLIDKMKLWLA